MPYSPHRLQQEKREILLIKIKLDILNWKTTTIFKIVKMPNEYFQLFLIKLIERIFVFIEIMIKKKIFSFVEIIKKTQEMNFYNIFMWRL